MKDQKIGTFSALSIGVGGMVGGGIFAITGLAIELTRGAAPVAFCIAGLVALLTAYSYWKLTLAFPSEGGTVDFLNRGYGTGILTGALNILLCMNYVVLLAIYAYAFGAYGARMLGVADFDLWRHILLSSVLLVLVLINFLGPSLVIRSENLLNIGKLILLGIFIIAGLSSPMPHTHILSPENYTVSTFGIISGAMIIFLNYEGFELIANAAREIREPRKSLPIAYMGGVILVMSIYALIAIVTVGHLSMEEVSQYSTYSLSEAARLSMGTPGFMMIGIAALLATSSAINATFYSSGRLTYIIAKSGELPSELERNIKGRPNEGMFIFAILTLLVANFVPLNAIATMGSTGFLLVFMAVNIVSFRRAREIEASRLISLAGALACLGAVTALCWQTVANPDTRMQIWILVGMIALAFGIEVIYRRYSGRAIHMGRE
ncbi:MAG: APC family permease [Myxococcota bacterium]|nr:APC family permease [Myxococcota bacterium]